MVVLSAFVALPFPQVTKEESAFAFHHLWGFVIPNGRREVGDRMKGELIWGEGETISYCYFVWFG